MSDDPELPSGDAVQVRDVEVDRTSGITITFADGAVVRLGLADVRHGCPCAGCRGERERGLVPGADDVTVVDAELVGAWGISFTWSDGHATGIYPWASLRRWGDLPPLVG